MAHAQDQSVMYDVIVFCVRLLVCSPVPMKGVRVALWVEGQPCSTL